MKAYVRLDSNFPEHFEGRSGDEIAAWVLTLCYAEQQPRKGRFKPAVLRALLGRRARYVALMVKAGDLVVLPDGMLYLEGWDEWQEGDHTVAERMRRIRARKVAPVTVPTVTSVTVPTVTPVTVPTVTLPSKQKALALAKAVISSPDGLSPSLGSAGGPVEVVFEAWKASTGRARAVLDPNRTALIRRALKTHPLEDVLAAVDGWRFDTHHRGENDRRRPYNDLELILRDPKHIEQFRDFRLGLLSSNGAGPKLGSVDERVRRMTS